MNPYDKNDPETIKALFNSIAKQYDRTNTVLSFNLHRYWSTDLVKQAILPFQPQTLLDLCCGTGDIAYQYLQHATIKKKIYLLDFCEDMLTVAKEKANQLEFTKNHELTFIQGDAQAIPLENSSVDCVTISYGIRNVKSPSKCMEEVFRVLKPGGTFGILELTRPKNGLWYTLYGLYLRYITPMIGRLFAYNQDAYLYLCDSINSFAPPSELQEMMKKTGFKEIRTKSHFGGVTTIFLGKR